MNFFFPGEFMKMMVFKVREQNQIYVLVIKIYSSLLRII